MDVHQEVRKEKRTPGQQDYRGYMRRVQASVCRLSRLMTLTRVTGVKEDRRGGSDDRVGAELGQLGIILQA